MSLKIFPTCFLLLFVLLSAVSGVAQVRAVGQLFVVNDAGDSADAAPGDNVCADAAAKCTLRAAIQESNSNTATRDAVIFSLPNPATIELTLGELVVTGRIYIVGPGARRLTIQRRNVNDSPTFRLFRIPTGTGQVAIRGMRLRNGDAGTGGGGAIANEGQNTVTLTDLWISDNTAGNGGAIANSGTVNLDRSLLTTNTASLTTGGAVDNYATTARFTATNSTFYQNSSAMQGGAIRNIGTVVLINDTFHQNTAAQHCETMCNGGTASVINTIFGIDIGPASSLEGTFDSLGNNVVVDPSLATGFVNGQKNDQVSDASRTVDPKLGPLADNGGETDTLPLLAGSPALNTGSNCVWDGNCPGMAPWPVMTDQRRRYSRKIGGAVDVGAFELGAAPNYITGSFSMGTVGGGPIRFHGTFGVMTSTVTNWSAYSPMNQSGTVNFASISDEPYIFQMRSKHPGLNMDPILISFGDPFPFAVPPGENGRTFKFDYQPKK